MKRKTAPQEAWEKANPYRLTLPNGIKKVSLTRAQFTRLWQTAYRRGMERAAGVAEATPEKSSWIGDNISPSAAWHTGRNAGAERIRYFVMNGAKDE